MTFRPGRVKQEFPIHLPRPRHIEETDVARTAARFWIVCAKKSISPWKWSTPMKKLSRQIIFYSALIGYGPCGEVARLAAVSVPAAVGSWRSTVGRLSGSQFLDRDAVTMKRMLSVTLVVVLGMILTRRSSYKFLEDTLGGLLVSLQSLPSICWIPLAVLWFGLTEKPSCSWS